MDTSSHLQYKYSDDDYDIILYYYYYEKKKQKIMPPGFAVLNRHSFTDGK